jgi:zinc transport system ATP-binding protein
MTEFAVEVSDLSVHFGDHLALNGLNFWISRDKFVAIVGPNGAGKTTLLKVILGIVQPSSGTVKVFSRPIQKIPPEWIGYVPQVKTMDRSFPALSIELVSTGLSRRWPWRSKVGQDEALHALEQVGAAHLAQRPVGRLSGGELQRVCLARSIVRKPKLVMLDEPATGVDAVGEADFYRHLEAYQKSSGAVIMMITHDWYAATHHADKVLLMNREQIKFGDPEAVLSEENLRTAFGHLGHEHPFNIFYKLHA